MSTSEEEGGGWSPWGEDEQQNEPLIPAKDLAQVVSREKKSILPTMGEVGSSSSNLLVDNQPSYKMQYFAAFSATLGALSVGAILGYSSPAGYQLSEKYNCTEPDCLKLTKMQVMWFSSTVNIGALIGGPVGGLMMNKIGRRGAMMASFVPFLAGWLFIGFANSFPLLIVGRFITGLCCGISSLVIPTYVGEYSSPLIRGTLGTGFQLMVVIGIVYSYIFGAIMHWAWLSLVCFIPCVFYLVAMFFSHESPSYLLSREKVIEAKAALGYFRGRHYNINQELNMMKETVEASQKSKVSLRDFKAPYVMKPLLISLALMVFQQFSGINAVLFNLTTIFEDAGSSISSDLSSIIIGVTQVAATLLSSFLMDKAGRRILLIISSFFMAVSLLSMGVFFFIKDNDEPWAKENLGWLPLVSLIIYIIFFSLGFGPIPWLMMGELFSANIREVAASIATLTNWSFAFIVTIIFVPLQTGIGDDGVYWLFTAFCVLAFLFSLLLVPETKGKTLEEITFHFGGVMPARNVDTIQQRT